MNPVFHDPKLAQETIEKLNNAIRELNDQLSKETDKISKEKGKLKTKQNGDARLEALEMKPNLTQEFAQEKAGTLEAAIKETVELETKLEVARGGSRRKQKKLDEVKKQLQNSDKKAEALKQELLQTMTSKDALEARIAHMEYTIKDLQGRLNAAGVASAPPDMGGVNIVSRRLPTAIHAPRNHPRIALKKFDRSDSDKPEIQKFKSIKVSSNNATLHKLEDSPAFQMFWKGLGIFIKAIPSRRKILSPLCGNASWTKIDLKRHLDELYQPFGFTLKFIFLLEGLLRWGPDKVNALAFAPLCIVKDGLWSHNDEFASVDGDTIEVFFLRRVNELFGVCYAGTYKCYHAHGYFPEGVFKPEDISSKSLSRSTMTYNDEDALRNEIRLYRTGELKADCAILECVGFDEELYERLSESSPKDASKRNIASSENLGSVKRVRI